MKIIEKEIQKELAATRVYISENEKALKQLTKNAPEKPIKGSIRSTTCRGVPQYYLHLPNQKDTYLSKSHLQAIRYSINEAYHEKMATALSHREKALLRLLKILKDTDPASIYEKLSVAKKTLVAPLVPTEEFFIRQWYEAHPGSQNPFPEECTYQTNRGEKVRSKSEKILADLFYSYQIPYQYEPALTLPNSKTLYPDFVLLNIATKKTLYWEHLGLIDQVEYLQKNIQKIQLYESNGILLGDTLITSIESTVTPLNIKLIKKKIEAFLL